MGAKRRIVLSFAAGALFAGTGLAQDSPSLGDLARQQRQQKVQSKTGPDKDAKSSKVITNKIITNEEISKSTPSGLPVAASAGESVNSAPASAERAKQSTESVKSEIEAQKNQIASLKARIDEFNESIHFAPGNCVSNCAQWNERQKEKQQQAERALAQLEELKKHLEEMQDSARKQGLGSSVYPRSP